MAYCTSTTLVFGMENANPDSKSSGAELGGHGDASIALSDEEPEDSDESSEHDDDDDDDNDDDNDDDDDDGDDDDGDDEDLDNTDEDDYYYDSEYEISVSSREGKNASQNGAENASNELDAFRAEWLQNLTLSEEIPTQEGKRPELLPNGGSQVDGRDSDGLSVSRLMLGDDENRHQFEDLHSSSSRVEVIGQEMDEFEQEQLLQEEMWKYYAATRDQREDGNASSGIPRTVAHLSHRAPLLYRVFDDESVSTYTPDGFIAGSSEMPSDASTFGQMVGNHAQWRSRVHTPFISVTDSQRVVQWQISIRNRPGIMVAIIDTSLFVDALDGQVWEMHELMDHFGVKPPGTCRWKSFEDEYLCALRIPECAVLEVCEPKVFFRMAQIYLEGRE